MGPLLGMHKSGIGQPSQSNPPGQTISSGIHSTGAISGHPETAAAAKRIVAKKAFMLTTCVQLEYSSVSSSVFYTLQNVIWDTCGDDLSFYCLLLTIDAFCSTPFSLVN